jgi:DNA-binding NarL/FixJ family response regulator
MVSNPTPQITIHNPEIDLYEVRDMNEAELAQLAIDNAKHAQAKDEAEAKATARASALAKLAALGLTADEIASL